VNEGNAGQDVRAALDWDDLWARADSLLEPARLIAAAIDRLTAAVRERGTLPACGERQAHPAACPQAGDAPQTPLAHLGLPRRLQWALEYGGVETVEALLRLTAEDVLSVRNVGVTSLQKVRQKLSRRGLALRLDPPPETPP
jgi:DNA-directed RNA polymerase alpha subunit